jgi:succinate dehydrogenase/fumarate reductase flavoprotein subunit
MAQQPWLPATWDRQADVVVIGLGAAGAATAITVYDAGAKVILLDKAPQGHEGGNTRERLRTAVVRRPQQGQSQRG